MKSREENQEMNLIIRKCLDKAKQVQMRNRVEITDFLCETEIAVIQETLKQKKLDRYFFEGGYEEAERKMLFFYPDKITQEMVVKDQYIAIIRILLPKEQHGMYFHRHYYSAMLSLGIKREKMGDILVDDVGADIVVTKEIVEYAIQALGELTRFQKASITMVTIEEIKKVVPQKESLEIQVPSMRMDVLVAELGKTARTKAVEWMKEGLVLKNNIPEDKADRIVKSGDILTIRRKGKFLIGEEKGKTRKGRIILEVFHYL